MAISSRLALWEQKIREEDKSPPPSSPPPLFSVIPGGFIRQLVRETEKESKQVRQRKEAALASPEQETPEVSVSQPKSKADGGTESGSRQTSGDSQRTSLQGTSAPGKDSQQSGGADPALMTSVNCERPQEAGPSGTPARKALPVKRGVRQGDVLLMVAKLDPEATKPEQRNQARDTPTCKTLPAATDPGGAKKGEAPGTSSGPQASTEDVASKPEKTPTRGRGDPGPGTKGEKGQGTVGKGSGDPQTKGPKGGEPKGKEEQRTRPQSQGAGDGGHLGTVEKEGGDPPSRTGKRNESKDVGAEGERAGAQEPGRKWGGSLSRGPQSKTDRESEPLATAWKTGKAQAKTAAERGEVQGEAGQAGAAPQVLEEAAGPGKASEASRSEQVGQPQRKAVGTGGAASQAGQGCTGATERVEPAAIEPEGRPEGSAQRTEEPCIRGPEPQQEGHAEASVETWAERPRGQTQTQEGPAQQDQGRGGHSGDLDQAHEDRWYEAEKVWLVQKDGFTLATVLKPDEGTADLPAGRMRLCIDADRTVTEVEEEHVHRANPPELDRADDLASLISVNESSVLNTLLQRAEAQLLHTCAGRDLIVLQPQGPTAPSAGKVPRGRRDGLPAHISSLAQRAYWAMLSQRRDQSIIALGRSGAGKTTSCEQVLEHLVGMAGSVDGRVSVEKIWATFTILRAFGSVCTGHSCRATRLTMVMLLDFNATGRVTAAQLQTVLLEKSRVVRVLEGEGTFPVFSQMLAGLDLDLRTELYLYQMADSSSFGMGVWSKPEDKQKDAAAFAQLQAAMGTLGITEGEQRAIWRVLAAIYHLGAAGACKGLHMDGAWTAHVRGNAPPSQERKESPWVPSLPWYRLPGWGLPLSLPCGFAEGAV